MLIHFAQDADPLLRECYVKYLPRSNWSVGSKFLDWIIIDAAKKENLCVHQYHFNDYCCDSWTFPYLRCDWQNSTVYQFWDEGCIYARGLSINEHTNCICIYLFVVRNFIFNSEYNNIKQTRSGLPRPAFQYACGTRLQSTDWSHFQSEFVLKIYRESIL